VKARETVDAPGSADLGWLGRDFEVSGLLARGARGSVLRARHLHLGIERAIKLLPPSNESAHRRRARLRRTSRARHPNLVDVHDLRYGPDGELALVLELVEGPSLREAMDRDGALDSARAVGIGLGVLCGLVELHRRGIVHRSISPEHVLLSSGPNGLEVPRLIGLGAAHAPLEETLAETTTLADLCLEARYRAPETFDPGAGGGARRQSDPRSDLYGVGLLLYEMLAAEPPFPAADLASVVDGHCRRQPPPLDERELSPPVRPELARVVERALAKSPGDRFRSAAEMARALAAATPGVPPLPPGIARERRLGRHAALGALALAVVGLLAAGALLRRPGDQEQSLRLEPVASLDLPDLGATPPPGPFGIAFDRSGNLYVGSENRHVVYKLAPDGHLLATWGGEGSEEGRFDTPAAIVVDGQDRLWVVDSHNHRLQLFDTEGKHLRTVGGEGTGEGTFRYPYDIALGADGRVFVVDQTNDLVQVLDREGAFLYQFGGPGAADGGFSRPWGIAVTSDRVLVTDNSTSSVAEFTLDGDFLRRWGSSDPRRFGWMSNVRGIAVDTLGRVAVANSRIPGVHVFDLAGKPLGTIGDSDAIPTAYDLALDASGRLWVTSNQQGRVICLDWVGP
jgi:sugar lactone lactonase YvrE